MHGTGPLMTSLTPNQTTLDHLVFEAVHELGGKFVYNQDMNSGDGLGFGTHLNPYLYTLLRC